MNQLPDEITRVFALQGEHRHAMRATRAAERIAMLQRLRAAIVDAAGAISAALAEDFGKPGFEAAGETMAVLGEIDAVAASLADWMAPVEVRPGPQAAPGAQARIVREPKGRVLIFGPWNYPFALLFQPLIGAIAAGNVCMLKPSELTPATSALCVRLIREVFDEADVAVFEGGPELAAELLDLPFDHIFFTGSGRVGKLVMAAAARHLASVTLELGGKSPVIVDEDVDLPQAAARVAWGKYMNAGQICLAPDYVLVRPAQRDAFVAEVARYVRESFYLDDTLNEADFGPIVDERNLQRLTGLIDDAVARGARVAFGGKARDGRRIEPTVLVDVPPEAAIMQEEIFGPIMPVLTYDDVDEVIAQINARDKPLALYVFSRRAEFVNTVLSRTSSGGATINDVIAHVTEPGLPFGGVGPSGVGAYHGVWSFLAFSHQRSVYHQADENPVESFLRPPYAGKLEMLTSLIG
jgi:aldehyde dehydrogenase (NAD+)